MASVGLSPPLCADNRLCNVADQIARDKDEVAGDDPVRVDVAQGISRRKRLLRRHDGWGNDLEPVDGCGPSRIPVRGVL